MKKNLILTTSLLIASMALFGQDFNKGVITERLQRQMLNHPGDFHHIGILLADRLDVLAIEREFNAKKLPLEERTATLLPALKAKARSTQPPLLDFLNGHPNVEAKSVRSYWIANAIYVKATSDVIEKLSWRADVFQIDWSAPLLLVEYEQDENCESLPPPVRPNGIEPGLAAIKAPELWKLGYTGAGRLALGADTGIDPTHPALKSKYRGYYAPEEQTWYEWERRTRSAYDCSDHGTHTMGTILGLDRLTRDTIGVAFNASYIGALIICSFSPSTQDNIAAFQWAIDPDDDPNTIADMPDVINNSWHDPSVGRDCESIYQDILVALEAVGIAVVFSAGNDGPDNSSITRPKNINVDLVNTFAVASINGNNANFPVSNSSSRGPSDCISADSSLLIKPEVSAPGVSVRSSVPEGGYESFSGTSMAAPHVAGAILLLKEAFPYLPGRDLKLALYYTCTDLGIVGEDNTYGMGIINVKAAYDYLVAEGHVPIPPALENDVVLLDVTGQEFFCNEVFYSELQFENNGTDTLHTVNVRIEIPEIAVDTTFEWRGTLLPGERTTFLVFEFPVPEGDYQAQVTLEHPNGLTDPNPYNNRIILSVKVISRRSLPAYVAGFENTVCENSQALLRSEFPVSDTVLVQWYDAPTGGNLVGTGHVFETPVLNRSTTYYAVAQFVQKVGNQGLPIDEIRYPPGNIGGLAFDALQAFTLKSVKVYADQAGPRFVRIRNAAAETIATLNVDIPTTGEQRIPINLFIPQGNDYRIQISSGSRLGYNTEGNNFPYEVDGIVSIKSSSLIGPSASYYFYFYDWEVSYREVCGRTPVRVEVVPGEEAPLADFSISARTIDLFNDPTVRLTDLSTGGTRVFWDFGDGFTSTAMNPSHTYIQSGTYIVSLTVFNDAGCQDTKADTIQVIDMSVGTENYAADLTQVTVFPNPTDGTFEVILKEDGLRAPEYLELFDLLGQPIQRIRTANTGERRFMFDLAGRPSGMYLLIASIEQGKVIRKVVKL